MIQPRSRLGGGAAHQPSRCLGQQPHGVYPVHTRRPDERHHDPPRSARMNVRRQYTGRPVWVRLAVVLGLIGLAAVGSAQTPTPVQPPKTDGQPPKVDAQPPKTAAKPGVSLNDPKAYKGYTLVAPMNSKMTYLIDMDGRVVKTWESEVTPGLSAYLLENGHLLRAGNLGQKGQLQGAGAGGRIQEFDWEGNLVWDYTISTKTQQQHHDIHRMPNGNVLLV